jgi:hypothetical protein
MALPNIRLSEAAYEDLNRLRAALKAEFGLAARNQDIASALIQGTSIPQAAGMLIAFNKANSEESSGE